VNALNPSVPLQPHSTRCAHLLFPPVLAMPRYDMSHADYLILA